MCVCVLCPNKSTVSLIYLGLKSLDDMPINVKIAFFYFYMRTKDIRTLKLPKNVLAFFYKKKHVLLYASLCYLGPLGRGVFKALSRPV